MGILGFAASGHRILLPRILAGLHVVLPPQLLDVAEPPKVLDVAEPLEELGVAEALVVPASGWEQPERYTSAHRYAGMKACTLWWVEQRRTSGRKSDKHLDIELPARLSGSPLALELLAEACTIVRK